MILARSLLDVATAAISKLAPERRRLPSESLVMLVEQRDEFFANLAADLKEGGFQVERAVSAAEATQRLRRESSDLILANCDLPDESGWLMVSKWCLTRTPRRVWLYRAWPAPFDQDWVDLTNIERILYHEDDVRALVDQVRHQLGFGIGSEQQGQGLAKLHASRLTDDAGAQ